MRFMIFTKKKKKEDRIAHALNFFDWLIKSGNLLLLLSFFIKMHKIFENDIFSNK